MNKIFFIIGASGSGKTTVIQTLEKINFNGFKVVYFDSVGVPSHSEMIEKHGTPEEWQRVATLVWVKTIKEGFLNAANVILEGQTRPQFIEEACFKNNISNYSIILFDCSDEERNKRLVKRGQPELANQQMMDWAKYLRETCSNFYIIDNTFLNENDTLSVLKKALESKTE